MAHLITERGQKRGEGELKAEVASFAAYEILLIAGIALVVVGIYVNSTNALCYGLTCDGYPHLFKWQFFYVAFGLLLASAVGFLFSFKSFRRTLTTPKEAPD
ncbi:MAG: hypothetical protein ACLQEQ_09765 [Nitrososphaerales archaeon]